MIEISIVIPAYNEEKRIISTLKKIKDYLEKEDYRYEIIVVDDGSKDRTSKIIKKIKEKDNRISLIHFLKNRGKGAAVKEGVLSAKGRYILFTDSDLSTPIEELDKLLFWVKERDYDIAIGSRGLPESKILIPQLWYREKMGKIFNIFVRLLVVPEIFDTQCGFKLFRRKIAQHLFHLQRVSNLAFDVEIIYLSKSFGYSVKEIPVHWINSPQSKVHLLSDSLRMLITLIKIFLRH